jgi:hypothetical protein
LERKEAKLGATTTTKMLNFKNLFRKNNNYLMVIFYIDEFQDDEIIQSSCHNEIMS